MTSSESHQLLQHVQVYSDAVSIVEDAGHLGPAIELVEHAAVRKNRMPKAGISKVQCVAIRTLLVVIEDLQVLGPPKISFRYDRCNPLGHGPVTEEWEPFGKRLQFSVTMSGKELIANDACVIYGSLWLRRVFVVAVSDDVQDADWRFRHSFPDGPLPFRDVVTLAWSINDTERLLVDAHAMFFGCLCTNIKGDSIHQASGCVQRPNEIRFSTPCRAQNQDPGLLLEEIHQFVAESILLRQLPQFAGSLSCRDG
jgi:hypothetical protein